MKIEIRWLEDKMGDDKASEFRTFIKMVEGDVTPVAVEEAFSSWLEEKVKGRNIVVEDLEITVDDEFYVLEPEQENLMFQRIGSASGR